MTTQQVTVDSRVRYTSFIPEIAAGLSLVFVSLGLSFAHFNTAGWIAAFCGGITFMLSVFTRCTLGCQYTQTGLSE